MKEKKETIKKIKSAKKAHRGIEKNMSSLANRSEKLQVQSNLGPGCLPIR